LGLAYATDGRPTEAFPLLEQTLERLTSAQMMIYRSLLLTSLSETYLLAGRTDDATHRAEEALRVSCDRGERGVQAHAIRLLGEIAAHRDQTDVETAEGRYAEAMTLADELGMRPLVAHCHFGLGKLWGRTGRPEQAREHLTTATTMYREMDMRFWLEQAGAEMKGLA
jgi:tetratricopeptide (TPR) repeat protein